MRSRYHRPTPTLWTGRTDTPNRTAFFQIIDLLDLTAPSFIQPDGPAAFALLGFCCDEGIARNQGRQGAMDGPAAIRRALAPLPLHRSNCICYDAGDIVCTDGDLESSQQALGEAVTLLLQQGITPLVLGGGHELAFGHYQGLAAYLASRELSIVNFDAHFDLRSLLPNNQGSSGTPFLQIANACKTADQAFHYTCLGIQSAGNSPLLFETAKKWKTQVVLADEIQQDSAAALSVLTTILSAPYPIYLSLCLDVFASAFAPGVSAPQSMGLTPWQLKPFIRQLAASGKVISYDLAELSPPYDLDQRTAKLAANFVYEIIHYHAPFLIIKE